MVIVNYRNKTNMPEYGFGQLVYILDTPGICPDTPKMGSDIRSISRILWV